MLNYLKKFALDVVPSVVATILGAYIVNHYITAKTASDTPPAAVASTTDGGKKADPKKALVKPGETSADVASIPEPGVKAKGISERAMIENRAAERPAEVKPSEAKPAETAKPNEKPAETASIASEPKRPQVAPAPREKTVAKTSPAAATAPAAETASASDEPRDANELAQEAIRRLRANSEAAQRPQEQRPQEASRQAEPPRIQDQPPRTAVVVPVVTAPAPVRPLPPPVVIAAPSPSDNSAQGPAPAPPPYTASVDPNRPTPPADIPPPRPPVDLKTEAANAVSHTKNVAEDMLAAAKSMFHAVLPGSDRQSSSASQFTD